MPAPSLDLILRNPPPLNPQGRVWPFRVDPFPLNILRGSESIAPRTPQVAVQPQEGERRFSE